MGAPEYRLKSTTSHRRGGVVVFQKKHNTTCPHRYNGKTRQVTMTYKARAFFDANNNGRLDSGDKTLETQYLCESCPQGSQRDPIKGSGEGVHFCVRSVTARDIKSFGSVASAQFKRAKRLRSKLAPIFKRMVGSSRYVKYKDIMMQGRKHRLGVKRGDLLGTPEPAFLLEAFGLKNDIRYVDGELEIEIGYSTIGYRTYRNFRTLCNFIDIK